MTSFAVGAALLFFVSFLVDKSSPDCVCPPAAKVSVDDYGGKELHFCKLEGDDCKKTLFKCSGPDQPAVRVQDCKKCQTVYSSDGPFKIKCENETEFHVSKKF
ncbi:uncharacterized protein LOC118434174 [Folsomia candida]|uniref:Iron-sulfur clusters transporter ATM1, mitochondrial n=1 Tax=Folsomia candida TaxID=158441 RepID=A0A226F4K5_FOLCA|nr:uncharacterized protein LOC118434174 [Folsomia candida]OXA64378.1 Iron-sulfur clusters transporter ATM1, mitochondrial [Folsomia candida]